MLQIANSTFQTLGNIQNYDSFAYIRRFYDLDECKLVLPATDNVNFVKNNIILYTFNEVVYPMIIRSVEKSTEDKSSIITAFPYGGIDRRIVDSTTTPYPILTDNISTIMETLLILQCIIPLNGARTIPYLSFVPKILGGTTSYQTSFQSLKQTLYELCLFAEVGYKIYYSGGVALFEVYQGETKPYIFSESLNNLKNVRYIDGVETNCTYTQYSDDTASGYVISDDTVSGINRIEDLNQSSSNNVTLSEFQNTLAEKKKQEEHLTAEIIENQYEYGTDFNVGDVITVEAYGKSFNQRVTEVVESYSQREGSVYDIKVGYPLPLLDDKILEKFKYLDNYIYRVYKMAGGI